MRDPRQRDRQRQIAPPEASASSGEGRSQVYAPNSIWTLGVVRDVGHYSDTVFVSDTGPGDTSIGDVIRWQRIRYKRGQVPTVGQYTAYGKIEDGYPQETKAGKDYTASKVSGTPTTSATIIRATWRHGFWIIESMSGGVGTVFPVTLVKTSGTIGSVAGPATWKYTVKDYFTNATLATAVDPTAKVTGTPGGHWKRPSVGQMVQASFGYAHRGADGQIVLGWINEQVVQQACTN